MKSHSFKTENVAEKITGSKPQRTRYTPRTAGNKAFRLHNSLRFLKTAEQKRIGRMNKT